MKFNREINCDLLLVAGSAGSLEVILMLLEKLESIVIPIVIVLHRKDDNDNLLIELLSGRTNCVVKEAEDKESIAAGSIYVCPPDYHLLIEKDRSFSLDSSERINFSRPSIDLTFETAAETYRSKLAAILLSGANADGAAGLVKIKSYGGYVVVQDPATAISAFMPKHALDVVEADNIIPAAELYLFVNSICGGKPFPL